MYSLRARDIVQWHSICLENVRTWFHPWLYSCLPTTMSDRKCPEGSLQCRKLAKSQGLYKQALALNHTLQQQVLTGEQSARRTQQNR